MSQVKLLLAYQQQDAQLFKMEQELASAPERKAYMQAKNFMAKAPEKADQYESKALELTALLVAFNKKYEEIVALLKDFENLDELVENGAETSYYKKSILAVSDQLKSLKNEINNLTQSVKALDEEYKAFKKKTIAVQKQYQESSAVYKELKEKKTAEMDGIKKELEKISGGIDVSILNRYNEKRKERIFPVLCSVKNERCSKCGTELSLADKENVKRGDLNIECEGCHRLLYCE